MALTPVSTGVDSLDELLGGLIPGDNVVVVCQPHEVYDALEAAFLAESAGSHPTLYVATGATGLKRALPAGVELLDASRSSPWSGPAALADELERRLVEHRPLCIVVDDLGALAKRWGVETALDFFARACPTMLQAGAVTYWRVPPAIGSSGIERIRQITQVLLELRGQQLHVHKAESRSPALAGSVHQVRLQDAAVQLIANPTAGRLARGLASVRRDLGLTQAQLAEAAGITASAISQAEAGTRGLSLDTLLVLSDRLGVSLDRLVSAAPRPGYTLTRHDRSRHSAGSGITPLADDAATGLRAYLVLLEGFERGTPPLGHSGIELVAVLRGLVQVEAGDDTPVLRSGDALLAEHVEISGWRNLRPDPAAFYWVLRD